MEEPVLADDLPRALVAGGPVPAEGASVSFTPLQIVTLRGDRDDGLNPDIAIALDHAGIGFLRDAAWSRAIARYGGDGRRGNDMRHVTR